MKSFLRLLLGEVLYVAKILFLCYLKQKDALQLKIKLFLKGILEFNTDPTYIIERKTYVLSQQVSGITQ